MPDEKENTMFESTPQCIANCLKTQQGSHVLYRTFGLNVVDATNPPLRRDILVQLSTFYPDVTMNNLQITQVNNNGNFYYTVDIKGN